METTHSSGRWCEPLESAAASCPASGRWKEGEEEDEERNKRTIQFHLVCVAVVVVLFCPRQC